MRTREKIRTAWSLTAAALGALLLAGAVQAQEDRRYGYLRVIEGPAVELESADGEASGAEASINQPLLVGDRLTVPDRGRVEAVLADGNIVRLDGGSEVTFTRLAASADSDDRASVLTLHHGNLQLVVGDDTRGDDFPRVETDNATIYIEAYGIYRITADNDLTEVVARTGRARVVTEGEEVAVRAAESAVIEGRDRYAEVSVSEAGAFDGLERWGRRLDEDVRLAEIDSIDSDYRYEAAALADHGSWITFEHQRYWRPRVADDWRPYWQGRWLSTPSGITWVSSEPWGWLPSHYGTWDYLPAYGWVWQPGYVYSPAWVYWYWGPSHVGWCPTGYYTRHYRSRFGIHASFRFGVYGWAGGDWGHYNHWNFVGFDRFRSRDLHRHARRGRDFGGTGRHAVPRGIITTDTRDLTPNVWDKPQRVAEVLTRRGRQGRQVGELPDVTSFVSRKPLAPGEVTHVVEQKPDRRLDGTPLKPDTLGIAPRRGRARGPVDPQIAGTPRGRGSDNPGTWRAAGPLDKPMAGGREGRAEGGEGNQPWRVHRAEGGEDKPLRPSRRPEANADGGTPRAGRDPMTGGVAVRPRDPAVPGGDISGGRTRPQAQRPADQPWRSHQAGEGEDKPFRSRRPEAGAGGGTPRAGRTSPAPDKPWTSHQAGGDDSRTREAAPRRLPGGWRELPGSSEVGGGRATTRERSTPRAGDDPAVRNRGMERGSQSRGSAGDSPYHTRIGGSSADKPAPSPRRESYTPRAYTPRPAPESSPAPRASRPERHSPPASAGGSEPRRGGGQMRGSDGGNRGGRSAREAGGSSRSGGGSRRGGGKPAESDG